MKLLFQQSQKVGRPLPTQQDLARHELNDLTQSTEANVEALAELPFLEETDEVELKSLDGDVAEVVFLPTKAPPKHAEKSLVRIQMDITKPRTELYGFQRKVLNGPTAQLESPPDLDESVVDSATDENGETPSMMLSSLSTNIQRTPASSYPVILAFFLACWLYPGITFGLLMTLSLFILLAAYRPR